MLSKTVTFNIENVYVSEWADFMSFCFKSKNKGVSLTVKTTFEINNCFRYLNRTRDVLTTEKR